MERGNDESEKGGRDRLFHLAENFEPVYKRKMTPQDGLRPQLVNLNNCDRILIEDVTLTNSPFWIIHPVFVRISSYVVQGWLAAVLIRMVVIRSLLKMY